MPNWLARDTSISVKAKMVYLVLASHITRGGAWHMGHVQIAEEAGISVSSTQRALAELRTAGLVWWDQRRTAQGDKDTNLYRISVDGGGSGQIDRQVRSEGPEGPVRVTDQKKEPTRRTRTTSSSTDVDVVSGQRLREFEQFWLTYPRKVGKQTAHSAYVKARRRGVMHTDILDGAQRYRDDPNRQDQYTAHPTTWLNRGGWEDDPLPARSQRTTANEAVSQTLALTERLRGTPGFSGAAGPWGQIGSGS